MTPGETGGTTVRRAGAADWSGVHRPIASAGLPLDGLTESHALFVAACADRIVGTAALERHGHGDTMAYLLRSVAVEDSERHSGIGARLVRRALRRIPPGAPVAVLTETAAGYFPRFGFVPVDRAELPATLVASPELRCACPASAQALLLHRR